jgi:endonuclease/exonuclease/phosphatase family metal-dependent hydrolase
VRRILLALLMFGLIAADAPGQDLRVMSFNIRNSNAKDGDNAWPNRRELLMKTIEAFDPDLLGLQEVLPLQASDVQQRFGSTYQFIGVGRDDGNNRGEMAAVLIRLQRFEKIREGHFWLSTTPEVVGSKGWDADLPRIVTWVELRDRKNDNQRLFFFNTHFDHKGVKARLESAALVRKKVAQIAGDAPVIITGDFNAPDGSPPHARLLGHSGGDEIPLHLTDSYRVIHPTPSADDFTPHPFTGKNDKPIRIDWILHTPHFRTRTAEIDRTNDDGRYPSDHFPVTAKLSWERK